MIASVAEGDAEDVNRAVSAARKAFDEGPWPRMSPYVTLLLLFLYWLLNYSSNYLKCEKDMGLDLTEFTLGLVWFLQERSKILLRFADLLEKHNDEIAALETWDNGKPFEQAAKAEVPLVIRLMRYYAGRWNKKEYNMYATCIIQVSTCMLLDRPVKFLYVKIPQVGQIRFMVSRFLLMDCIKCKPCMNPLALLDRLSPGISHFSCMLGRLDLH